MSFLAPLLLLGLVFTAIPPIIHLLARRRFDVVDWAAMQFLRVSERTRRKIFLEELLLMLLRMGLIAIVALALAAPFLPGALPASWAHRAARDVVLIFDGSDSMAFAPPERQSAREAARLWAESFVDGLRPGDGVALLQAKQQVVPVLPLLSHDVPQIRAAIEKLPPPRGGADWPSAVAAAAKLLANGTAANREIILLTDNQRYGWADEQAQLRWELLAGQLTADGRPLPAVRVIDLDPARPSDAINWSLSPLRVSRAVAAAGQQVRIRTAVIRRSGDGPPPKVTIAVDGRPLRTITPAPRGQQVQIPLTFQERFPTPGSHLITVSLEPDALPGDNRQDLAIEVLPALPVLIVDAETRPGPRPSDFLRDALSPARDPNPSVRAKVVAADQLDAALLARDIPGPNSAPRVVILVNVPRLTPEAQRALEGFLSAGGGVLATMGDRCDGAFYTDQLYREGTGWLPARPIEPVGDESAPERAARIVPASLFHPAVELFREPVPGGLGDGRLPRYWKLSARDSALSTAIAMLTTGDPFLVERPTGKGRALVCCVPLDNSWRTNLPDLPAFAPLAHELVSYLAGARSADSNLQPGQPIVFRPSDDEPPGPVRLQPPDGPPVTLPVASWPLTYDEAREPGVYTLTTASGRTAWFVVQTDAREADLAAATDADRERVAGLLPKRPDGSPMLRYVETGGGDAAAEPPQNLELGWLAFLAVVLLLLGEVALTRRLAMAR